MPNRTILILGGTNEAALIADRLAARPDLRVVTALAGRTARPAAIAGEMRVGGFGGTEGLATYLREQAVDMIVDATHPFAVRISKNAAEASAATGTPCVVFVRPEWKAEPADRWQMVGSVEEAAAALPSGAHALLALGSQHVDPFRGRGDCRFLLRMIDPPADPSFAAGFEIIAGRPARDPADEVALLRAHAVSHIVCRNSGGTESRAKLVAARSLSLPVIMIRRPPEPDGPCFSTVEALLAAIG